MTKPRILTAAVIGLALGIPGNLSSARAEAGTQTNGDSIIVAWNEALRPLLPPGPSNAQRAYSILHVAMFEAVNAIERVYTPYRVHIRGARGASPEAAAAQAGHDILSALFPAQQGTFDALLESQLADLPRGRALLGRFIGHRAAVEILDWRQNDGWAAPQPAYVLPPFPGLWQPTPPAFSIATFTHYPNVTPFALLTATQYLPPPPPTLTSERYATDFDEVKRLGSATSTERTEEQTLLARLFAGVVNPVPFVTFWNMVTADLAEARSLSLVDTARLFVLVNVSIHDGLQTSFTSKFVYGLWRPVTAIQRADEDLNDLTIADPNWLPLLATPPYPSYAGNASCLSTGGSRALALALGTDDVAISFTWPGTPAITREFTSLSQLSDMAAKSRIWGGIHYQFDTDASQVACAKVAEYVFTNFMRPRPDRHDESGQDDE
jgi:hypothetical protein